MNYVTRVLQPGENVMHATRMHSIIFLPAVLWFAGALVLLIAAFSLTGDLRIGGEALAAFCVIFGAASGIPALVRRTTTELAVTDRRVIYKSGVFPPHAGNEPQQGRKRRCRPVAFGPYPRLWHDHRTWHRRQPRTDSHDQRSADLPQ